MPDGISDNELRRLANQRLGWPACAGCGTALTRDDTSAECNRCVTTDPGAADRVAYLEGRLADERAAHAKTQELAGVWPAAAQEIRARALDAAVRLLADHLGEDHLGEAPSVRDAEQTVIGTAGRFVDWMYTVRDGSVPGEPT